MKQLMLIGLIALLAVGCSSDSDNTPSDSTPEKKIKPDEAKTTAETAVGSDKLPTAEVAVGTLLTVEFDDTPKNTKVQGDRVVVYLKNHKKLTNKVLLTMIHDVLWKSLKSYEKQLDVVEKDENMSLQYSVRPTLGAYDMAIKVGHDDNGIVNVMADNNSRVLWTGLQLDTTDDRGDFKNKLDCMVKIHLLNKLVQKVVSEGCTLAPYTKQ